MNTPQLRSHQWVAFLFRWRVPLLVGAVVLSILAGWRTVLTYANLRSDIEELLPESAPSVAALRVLRARLPGLRHLGIVIDTGGPQNLKQAERFVDDLAARLRTYPKTAVSAVQLDTSEEQRFAETYALQLMDPEDVQSLREAVEERRNWEVGKETGANLDDEESAPEIPWRSLEAKYRKKYELDANAGGGRFVSGDGKTMVIVVQVASTATSFDDDNRLLERVKADVRALNFPKAYAGDMRIGYAGDIMARVEEMIGLASDLGLSTIVITLLEGAIVIAFYRSLRALAVLGLPLVCGTLCTFGLVALPPLRICSLNTNTAFLGAIVVGNGINCGIILLARYQEERLKGHGPIEATKIAVETTWKPTLAASAAAAAAYASLLVTAFRGFNQFGWIGGTGMLVCWVVTYALVPILARAWDPMPRVAARSKDKKAGGSISRFAATLVGHPRWVVGIWALTVVAGIFGIWHRRGNWIEYDLSRLRRRDSAAHGEQYWGARMDNTLRRYLTPTLIMAPNGQAAQAIRSKLDEYRRDGKAAGLIASVRTINDVLAPRRGESLAEAKKLKVALTPAVLGSLSPEDRERAERAVSSDALVPLRLERVPNLFVAGLKEFDGRVDRNVMLYPKLTSATWDGNAIIQFSHDVREAAEYQGQRAAVAGALLLSGDIASAMRADGPIATGLSLAVVLVICLLAFRSLRMSLSAMASLFVGVTVMLGGLAWVGAKLNFSNFIAMPITFGIAADYSINLLRRYQSEGNPDPRPAVRGSGGAVALCSGTTIIGFGSLLLAQNRALFSFGVMAVAGEIACLTTAVVLLPAALLGVHRWRLERTPQSRVRD
jgi:predicted RND superfamily exporter protein